MKTSSDGSRPADGSDPADGARPPGLFAGPIPSPAELDVLKQVEQRVLWLATRIVDEANRRAPGPIKVGGHQASSASMVSVMTALWFAHISGEDKVAVKPHASPVYHAIKYLTGELRPVVPHHVAPAGRAAGLPVAHQGPRRGRLLHRLGGPGRGGPPVRGRHPPLRRPPLRPPPSARFIAIVGDAELDEGNVWEAISDPTTADLGNVTMVIDLNRQSLDRVIPDIQATRLMSFFGDAGWHVVVAKYGSRLTTAFAEPNGDALRAHIDAMPNEAYQSLFALAGPALRAKLYAGADPAVRSWAEHHDDDELKAIVTDLGGHDLGLLVSTLRSCDDHPDRPSVVFAYTIKGWGLPIAGDPLNHAALLTPEQIDAFREQVGLTPATEWDRFDPGSAPGRLCAAVGADINNLPPVPRPVLPVPAAAGPLATTGMVSTQEAFGRVLTRLGDVPGLAERIVTTAPDVSISTNLGGWINKTGVFWPTERDDHGGAERLLRWEPSPTGQHIELGISEMNLFMLLGQLGLSHEHHGQHLLPVGTVYDPFVLRGLDALIYGLYNGSRFVVAGTPSGVTLAPEGGAHQSTITPSVGLELPGINYVEPAFATEVDWLLCDALARLGAAEGESCYLRLSTRPVDQALLAPVAERLGPERLRAQVLAGGYRLVERPPSGRPGITLVTTGVTVVEATAAAEALDGEGVDATVVHLTSPDRVFRAWQAARRRAIEGGLAAIPATHLDLLVPPAERSRPVVSVHDAASHSLAWLGSALGTRQLPLGVDRFGESGTIDELHALVGISADHIVNAALLMTGD